ncbi:MAG: lipoprotein signal peptidase [Bacteroidetes bacterium]|nr:lipoprotein signal peptidase [Bacteroidota bacterium]
MFSDTLKKYKIPLITVLAVLFIDQFIKIYIKLNYPLGEVGRAADWCIIHFTENPGMAFGFEFGGDYGKLALSVFRILACIGGIWYIRYIVKKEEHAGFVFAVSLILAGAMGNIFDSAFYGLMFDKGTLLDANTGEYIPYDGIAGLNGNGYAPPMYGCVVDMFYFPLIDGTFPDWMPFVGGEPFQFFRPIFNFADASISIGVATIIIFQKRFTKKPTDLPEVKEQNTLSGQTNTTEVN